MKAVEFDFLWDEIVDLVSLDQHRQKQQTRQQVPGAATLQYASENGLDPNLGEALVRYT